MLLGSVFASLWNEIQTRVYLLLITVCLSVNLSCHCLQGAHLRKIKTAVYRHCLLWSSPAPSFLPLPTRGFEGVILLLVPRSLLDYFWISQYNMKALLDLSSVHTLLSLAES